MQYLRLIAVFLFVAVVSCFDDMEGMAQRSVASRKTESDRLAQSLRELFYHEAADDEGKELNNLRDVALALRGIRVLTESKGEGKEAQVYNLRTKAPAPRDMQRLLQALQEKQEEVPRDVEVPANVLRTPDAPLARDMQRLLQALQEKQEEVPRDIEVPANALRTQAAPLARDMQQLLQALQEKQEEVPREEKEEPANKEREQTEEKEVELSAKAIPTRTAPVARDMLADIKQLLEAREKKLEGVDQPREEKEEPANEEREEAEEKERDGSTESREVDKERKAEKPEEREEKEEPANKEREQTEEKEVELPAYALRTRMTPVAREAETMTQLQMLRTLLSETKRGQPNPLVLGLLRKLQYSKA